MLLKGLAVKLRPERQERGILAEFMAEEKADSWKERSELMSDGEGPAPADWGQPPAPHRGTAIRTPLETSSARCASQ